MSSVNDVVAFFLTKESMSPKKLQRLLYYAYSWVLALLNNDAEHLDNKLFAESFEAWMYGPVLPSIYFKCKKYGWKDIPMVNESSSFNFSSVVENILEQVWDVYGEFSGDQLDSICRNEEPWIKARNGIPAWEPSNFKISDADIFNFYGGVNE